MGLESEAHGQGGDGGDDGVLVGIRVFREPRKQIELSLSGCLWARALRKVKTAC